MVNIADDVCDEGENMLQGCNVATAEESATPRKPDKGRRVAGTQAKLVMATQNGKLRDRARGALLH